MGSSTTSPEYVYHSALLMWLLTLSTSQMGIFAEVGPLNCFVSQQVRALSSQSFVLHSLSPLSSGQISIAPPP
jgi:hypothetical protein